MRSPDNINRIKDPLAEVYKEPVVRVADIAHELSEQDASDVTEALNIVLTAAGIAPGGHPFAAGVMGAAPNSKDFFKLRDRDLAARIHSDKYSDDPDAGKKCVQRSRKAYEQSLTVDSPLLIECKPGRRFKAENEKHFKYIDTEYRTCLPLLVAKVLRKARASSLWRSKRLEDRAQALRIAAESELKKLSKHSDKPKRARRKPGLREIVKRNTKTMLTNCEKTVAELERAALAADEAQREVYSAEAAHYRVIADSLRKKLTPENLIVSESVVHCSSSTKKIDDTHTQMNNAITPQGFVVCVREEESLKQDKAESARQPKGGTKSSHPDPVTAEVIEELRAIHEPRGVDIDYVHKKFLSHCKQERREPTAKYFRNFAKLERPESPLASGKYADLGNSATARRHIERAQAGIYVGGDSLSKRKAKELAYYDKPRSGHIGWAIVKQGFDSFDSPVAVADESDCEALAASAADEKPVDCARPVERYLDVDLIQKMKQNVKVQPRKRLTVSERRQAAQT